MLRQIILVSLLYLCVTPARVFRRFKVVHEAVEVIRARPEFPYRMEIRKFNKTTPVLDADFVILDAKVNTFQMWVEGFERLGMEHIYTKSAVSLAFPFCDFLAGNIVFNRGFRDFGNLPTSCPFKTGNYSLRNWIVEEKYLPPFVPGIHWRLDFYLGPKDAVVKSNDTGKFSYYVKVVYL